jgi:hypothetical protein
MTESSGKKVTIDEKIRILALEDAQSEGTSQGGTADLTIAAGERLYSSGIELMKARVQRHAEERAQRELTEVKKCPFKPTVDKPSEKHDMDEFVKRMAVWTKARDRKHNDKVAKHEREEMEDVTHKPQLDKLSTKLVQFKAKRKQYVGPVKGWKRHFTSYMVQKHMDDVCGPKGVDPQYSFKPSINPASKTLHFPTPVTERLYKDTQHREAQMELIRTWDRVRQGYDVRTGQPLFRPATNSAASVRSRTPSGMSSTHSDVVSSLLERGEDYREKRRLLEQEKFKELSFAPKTNSKSKQIVREIATRGPTPSRRKKVEEAPPPPKAPWNRSRSAEPAKFHVDRFYTRVSQERDYHSAKMSVLREQYDHDAASECTFQPKISRNSELLFRRSHGGNHEEVSPPMYRGQVRVVEGVRRDDPSPWIAPAGTTGRPEDFTPTPIAPKRSADSTEPASATSDKSDFLRSLENELRSTVEDWKKK